VNSRRESSPTRTVDRARSVRRSLAAHASRKRLEVWPPDASYAANIGGTLKRVHRGTSLAQVLAKRLDIGKPTAESLVSRPPDRESGRNVGR